MSDLSLDLSAHTDVHVLFPSTTHDDLRAQDKTLPSDTHLCRYIKDGTEVIVALRAYKKVDIFDALHDNGCQVLEITAGYGSIKPKLYGFQKSGE